MGMAIEFIDNPSEELKILAVQQHGDSIFCMKNPSEELKRLAVQQRGMAIRYIDNPSEEVQKLAVKKYGNAIFYIKNPNEEIQRLAVQQNGEAIQFIDNPSEEIKRLAVKYGIQKNKITYVINIKGYALTGGLLFCYCKKIYRQLKDHSFYVLKGDDIELFHNYEEAVLYKITNGGDLFPISRYYELLEEEILYRI